MLLPDPRALACHADLRWLGKIRGTARARYRDDRLDLSGCGEKVRKLIANAVVADGIQILVKEVQLFSPEFEEKVEALATDAKASEMEHAIRHEINVRVEEEPGRLPVAARAAGGYHRGAAGCRRAALAPQQPARRAAGRADPGAGHRAPRPRLRHLRPAGEVVSEEGEGEDRDLRRRQPRAGVASRRGGHPVHGSGRLAAEGRPAAADAQPIKRQLRAGGIDDEAVESLATDIVDLAKVRTNR